MVDVGLAYMDGTDFLQSNDQEAYRWFKKVSDLDNTDGDYYLGMLLQNQKKFKQAEYWYRRGAEKGDAYCQYAMGYLYEHGVGVEQNYQQAKAWYSEAAEQEHANAQFAMGLFYHDGLGGEVDYSKAREWYERSAVNNVAAAVNNLAVMYENGDGVEQDDDTVPFTCIAKPQIWVQQLRKSIWAIFIRNTITRLRKIVIKPCIGIKGLRSKTMLRRNWLLQKFMSLAMG